MESVAGILYHNGGFCVVVGEAGPKWARLCSFHDGGALKIKRVPAQELRRLRPLTDGKPSTPEGVAKRYRVDPAATMWSPGLPDESVFEGRWVAP